MFRELMYGRWKMESAKKRQRRVSTALVREPTDWGVVVSEKQVRKFWLNALLFLLSVAALFCGLTLVLPLIVAWIVSAKITGAFVLIVVVVAFIGLAVVLNYQSRKGPRNALEIDHNASELRLGFINRYGAFVRQRVISLSRIENALVEDDDQGRPALNFVVNGERVRVTLADAKSERLSKMAAQINDAAVRARNAPRRSRIRSAIAGISANYREIGNRVVSRVLR